MKILYMMQDVKEIDGVVWTGLTWIRMGTGGGLFVNMVINLQVA
jgi:hypothetical protein